MPSRARFLPILLLAVLGSLALPGPLGAASAAPPAPPAPPAAPASATFAVAAATAAAAAQPAASADVEPTPERRLAVELARLARTVVANPAPTPDGIRSAVVLSQLAAELAPEDPDNWRQLLAAARIAEEPEVARRALGELGRLAPADQVVQLARLQAAMDERGQTIEDRSAFLEFLLEAAADGRLAAPIASRVAFELALLRQRAGDLDGFAAALLDALELDPSHVAAARTALQFFNANVQDSVDEAELLVNLLMADPTDAVVMESLARLLMREGAYDAASRVYAVAVRVLSGGAAYRTDVAEDLIADQSLAMWASGDVDGAIRVLEDRERFKQDVLETERERRRRMEEIEPGSTFDLEPLPDRAPLSIGPAMVRLAIIDLEGPSVMLDRPAARRMGRVDEARAAGARAEARAAAGEPAEAPGEGPRPRSPGEMHAEVVASLRAELDDRYARTVEAADEEDGTGLLSASSRLDHAWAAVTLFEDPATARQRLEEAKELGGGSLTEDAEARFEGWIQLREGDVEGAIATLRPVAERDPLARLGLALALEESGDEAAARVELRGVAVAARGTLPGVWAHRRLAIVHGERLGQSAVAARLAGLVSTIPSALDGLSWSPAAGLRLRADFRSRTFGPFDPILLDIELVNNGPVPLALDPRGPIVPSVLLEPQLTSVAGAPDPPMIIVDLHRRLRLESRERLRVTVDLRRHPIGGRLHDAAVTGSLVRVGAYLNHDLRQSRDRRSFLPRPLGADSRTELVRIDGVDVRPRRGGGGGVQSPDIPALIRSIAGAGDGRAMMPVLGLVNRFALTPPIDAESEAERRLRTAAGSAIVEAFPELAPVAQAWILATSPTGRSYGRVRELVEASDEILVRAVWLITMVGTVDDPVLLASLESDDERLRTLALAVDQRLRGADIGR